MSCDDISQLYIVCCHSVEGRMNLVMTTTMINNVTMFSKMARV